MGGLRMVSSEPIHLREWEPSVQCGRLHTCGRPGRYTYDRAKLPVGEDIIDLWVKGLPEAEVLHIVSLLGEKTNPPGYSEFSFYPFRSAKQPGTKPTFQDWLNTRYRQRYVVHEFPTVDGQGVPEDVLREAGRCALSLLKDGCTIVVVDSAGCERTARLCESIGYKPITRS